MGDSLEGEVKFDYQQFTTGVEKMLAALEKLGPSSATNFDNLGKAAEAGMGKVKKSVDDLQDKVNAVSLKAIQDQFKDLGSKLNGKAFDDVVGKATSFDGAMQKVNISAKLSDAALADLGKQILGLNRELGTSIEPVSAVNTELQIMRSGFKNTADATNILRSAFLIAGNDAEGLSDAAKSLTVLLNAYKAGAGEAADYTDILARASSLGAGNVGDLSDAVGKVAPAAAAAGIPFKEVAAAMSLLGKNGTPAAQSASELSKVINSLVDPSTKAQQVFDRLNLTIDSQTLKADGLAKTLAKITQAANASGDAERALDEIFGKKQGLKIGGVLGGLDGNALSAEEAKFATASGAAAEKQKQLAALLENQAKQTAAAFKTLAIEVGTELLPVATKFAEVARFTVEVLDLIPKPVLAGAVALTALAGGLATMGATISGIGVVIPAITGGFAKLAGLLTAFVGQGAGAAAALGAAGEAAGAAGVAAVGAEAGMAGFFATIGIGAGAVALLTVGLGALAVAFGVVAVENAKAERELENLEKNGINKDGKKVFANQKGTERSKLFDKSPEQLIKSGLATVDDYNQADLELKNRLEKERAKATELAAERDEESRSKQNAYLYGGGKSAPYSYLVPADPSQANSSKSIKLASAEFNAAETQQQIDKNKANRSKAIKFADEKKKNPTGALGPLLSPAQLRKLFQDNAEGYANKREDILDNEELSPRQKAEMLRNAGYRYGKARDKEGNLDPKADRARRKEIAKLTAQADKSDFADSLQGVKESKDTHQEKIARLQELAAANKNHADRLRQINAQIASEEKAADEDHRKRIIETAKIRQEQQAAVLKGLQTEQAELEKAASRGANNLQARQANLEKQGDARANIAKQKANQELGAASKIDDPAERAKVQAQIKAKYKQEEAEIDADTGRKKSEQARAQSIEDIQRNADNIKSQEGFKARKIELLKEELGQGKDVQSQLKQAIQDRLALQEQEIKAQAELDKKANENDPRKIANIELEAQGRILDARKAARAEIEASTEAWNRQREAREKAQGGSSFGKIQSFEEFLKENNSGNSAVDERIKQIRAQNSKDSSIPGNLSLDALKAEAINIDQKSQILNLNPKLAAAAKAAGQGPIDSSGQAVRVPEVPISIKGEFVIRDQYGRDYTHESKVTVGGRNGKVSELARGMSARGIGGL